MNDESLFAQLLCHASKAEREAALQAACQHDPAQLQRMAGLLRAHDQAPRFLDEPALLVEPAPITPVELSWTLAERYRLVSRLGEGGMGAVFRAEQLQPVVRPVAVKVLRAGLDSRHLLHRFEAERQALAMMDHPHIAKVFDAGTTPDGRPYFVMELAEGLSITRYCDEMHLPPEERLALFVMLCQAVQHAHQKGIIHRDLKPSNVIVTLLDGKPTLKVIDFGVAKQLHPVLESTELTEVGMVIGTLQYMSPEQAELTNLDIDTRTDIYSLGVILYELLAGSPPFTLRELKQAAFTEMLRHIREVEPAKPSTKLSSSDELAKIAAHRRLEPKRLQHLVQGDLDWIVMKALAKERDRRYETASSLAMDLQRYLRHEPVEARPPSAAYRLRKLIRRNRGATLAAALVIVSLLVGIVGVTWGWLAAKEQLERTREAEQREREQRILAEKHAAQSAENADIAVTLRNFWEDNVLRGASTEHQFTLKHQQPRADITVRALLKQVAKSVDRAFPDRPTIKANLQKTIGRTLREIGEYEAALPHLDSAVSIYRQHLGETAWETLDVTMNYAVTLNDAGQAEKANRLLVTLLAHLDKHFPEKTDMILAARNTLCLTYEYMGQRDKAIAEYERLVEMFQRLIPGDDSHKALVLSNLAHAHLNADQWQKALPLLPQALAMSERVNGKEHPDTVTIRINYLLALRLAGRYDEAVQLGEPLLPVAKRILGVTHPNVGVLISHLGHVEMKRGSPAAAAEYFTQLYHRRELQKTTGMNVEYDLVMAIQQWMAAKQYDKAEPLARDLLAHRAKTQADSWKHFSAMALLGRCQLLRKQYADALSLLERAHAGMTTRFASMPDDTHYNITLALDALVTCSEAMKLEPETIRWRQEREKWQKRK